MIEFCVYVSSSSMLNSYVSSLLVGRDSSVGIAIRSPDRPGPGIESQWGEIFHSHRDQSWVPQSLLHSKHQASFPCVKRPGRGVNHLFPSLFDEPNDIC